MIRLPFAVAGLTALWFAIPAIAHAALSSADIEKLCANVEGSHDCGRRIEATVIAKLPSGLAKRNGDDLTIALLSEPGATGSTPRSLTFTDKEDAVRGIAYTVWDYLPMLDAVVLYVNEDVNSHFLWVGRNSGKTVSLPAEPVIAPDNKRLVTVDFCADNCTNEIVVWQLDDKQVHSDLPTKVLTWAPKETWTDADATWSFAGALNISYQKKGASAFSQMTRRLSESDWRNVSP